MVKYHKSSKTLIFFLLLAIFMSISGLFFPVHHDEGVFLTISGQMSKGYVPYLDYFDHKPPGIYLVLMLLKIIFGQSILIIRSFVLIVNLISSILIYFIGRRLFSFKAGLFSAVVYMIINPVFQGNFSLTEPFVNLFILASFVKIIELRKYYSLLNIFLVGLLLGIASIFKQAALVLIPVYLFFVVFNNNRLLNNFIVFLSALISPYLIVFLVLNIYGAVSEAFQQIFVFNLVNYHPWPFLELIRSFPKFIYPLPILWLSLVYVIFKKKKNGFKTRLLIFSIISIIPLLLFRPYHHYWIIILPFVLLLVSPLFTEYNKWSKAMTLNLFLVSVIFFIYTINIALPEREKQFLNARDISDCSQDLSPQMYFLSGCEPFKKYFYEPTISFRK